VKQAKKAALELLRGMGMEGKEITRRSGYRRKYKS